MTPEQKEAYEALLYLAVNERPQGGEDRFNAAHLYQIANALAANKPAPAALMANAADMSEHGKLWDRWQKQALGAAPLDAERVREAWAYRVHDFHVARSPVKARAKFPEVTEHLYPARRHADAVEMARLLGGTCTPLYPPEDAR